jgi:hypothetical protein
MYICCERGLCLWNWEEKSSRPGMEMAWGDGRDVIVGTERIPRLKLVINNIRALKPPPLSTSDKCRS